MRLVAERAVSVRPGQNRRWRSSTAAAGTSVSAATSVARTPNPSAGPRTLSDFRDDSASAESETTTVSAEKPMAGPIRVIAWRIAGPRLVAGAQALAVAVQQEDDVIACRRRAR